MIGFNVIKQIESNPGKLRKETMQWHKLEADDLLCTDIQDQFSALIGIMGPPYDIALFRTIPGIRPSTLYFSPACSKRIKAFLDRYGCEPCEAPARESLSGLALDVNSLDSIFSSLRAQPVNWDSKNVTWQENALGLGVEELMTSRQQVT